MLTRVASSSSPSTALAHPASSSAAIAASDMRLLISTLRHESPSSASVSSEGAGTAEQNVYALLVDRLILCGEYERAVQLANRHLPQGAGDTLIVMLLDNSTAVHSSSAVHVSRISDAETCAEMCLKYYSLWPSSELCVRILGTCLRRLSRNSMSSSNSPQSLRRPALQKLFDQMTCYDAILTHCPKWRKQGP